VLDLIGILLNLLFDNIFIVVALFGIVSFLLNKARGVGAPPPQRRPGGGMPPFGGEGPIGVPVGRGPTRGEPGGGEARPTPKRAEGVERAPGEAGRSEERGTSAEAGGETARPTATAADVRSPLRDEAGAFVASERLAADASPRRASASGGGGTGDAQSRASGAATGAVSNGAAFDPRRAAQGMIWAEVYGPPRALRPHRFRKK